MSGLVNLRSWERFRFSTFNLLMLSYGIRDFTLCMPHTFPTLLQAWRCVWSCWPGEGPRHHGHEELQHHGQPQDCGGGQEGGKCKVRGGTVGRMRRTRMAAHGKKGRHVSCICVESWFCCINCHISDNSRCAHIITPPTPPCVPPCAPLLNALGRVHCLLLSACPRSWVSCLSRTSSTSCRCCSTALETWCRMCDRRRRTPHA